MLTTCMLLCATLASPMMAAAQSPAASGAQSNPPEVLSKVERRHRLAHCAAQWQKMKRTGADVHLIWREFSATCMEEAATARGPEKAAANPSAQRALKNRP